MGKDHVDNKFKEGLVLGRRFLWRGGKELSQFLGSFFPPL